MEKKNELIVIESPDTKKMTLEEYESKYSGKTNLKRAKSFLILIVAAIGVGMAALLTLVVFKVFDINQYAGYAAIGVAVLIFILCYIVPVVKISKIKPFMVDVDSSNARRAQRYNKKLREDIADKMIELHSKTRGVDWYSDESIGKLAVARQTNNDIALKAALTEMYNGEVKKKANSIIHRYAGQIGLITAISQSDKIDTLVVATFELNLIKRLVYLYGYRPSDARLLRIYGQVLTNSLIAYGASSFTSNLALGVVNSIGGAMEKIPVLGQAVATAIGSTTQGVINGVMTIVIGFQTLRYLKKEYHLQDILDTIDLGDEVEEEMMGEVRKEIMKSARDATKEAAKKSKSRAVQPA